VNNRRAFYSVSGALWSQALESGRPLAVILMDLDWFKRINDRYGHAAGDAALRATVSRLGAVIRKQDVIARWGGEEFIVLLPDTDADEAQRLAERLRARVADAPVIADGQQITVTASFGVAARGPETASFEGLIGLADRCLYRAKAEGRNRVVTCGTREPPESEGRSSSNDRGLLGLASD
jgi:diguanylate cyclase (GGDEF)-like protein